MLLHCQQRGHGLDSIPQIPQSNILIRAMLVVIVIDYGNTDAGRFQIVGKDVKRDAAAQCRHFDHASVSAFDGGDYLLEIGKSIEVRDAL
jgi:hypothetical protein